MGAGARGASPSGLRSDSAGAAQRRALFSTELRSIRSCWLPGVVFMLRDLTSVLVGRAGEAFYLKSYFRFEMRDAGTRHTRERISVGVAARARPPRAPRLHAPWCRSLSTPHKAMRCRWAWPMAMHEERLDAPVRACTGTARHQTVTLYTSRLYTLPPYSVAHRDMTGALARIGRVLRRATAVPYRTVSDVARRAARSHCLSVGLGRPLCNSGAQRPEE